MYSDLSDYNGSVTHSSKRTAKTKSSHVKKAPSLGSLLDGKISSQPIPKKLTIDGESGATVMAETAQVEVVKEMPRSNKGASSKETTQQPQEVGTSKNELEPESQNQNDVSTKQPQNGEKGDS